MLASILNTPRATAMSIYVVRAFIRLKKLIHNHKDWLYQKILELEKNFSRHDADIRTIFNILKKLMTTTETTSVEPKRITGFSPK